MFPNPFRCFSRMGVDYLEDRIAQIYTSRVFQTLLQRDGHALAREHCLSNTILPVMCNSLPPAGPWGQCGTPANSSA